MFYDEFQFHLFLNSYKNKINKFQNYEKQGKVAVKLSCVIK